MSTDELVGSTCTGHFKSFHVDNGWGFITSPDFTEDIFVSYKTAPELREAIKQLGALKDVSCSFTLMESEAKPGQFEAQGVSVDIPEVSAADLIGEWCPGTVKSFAEATGWGFLKCARFEEDVFVSFKTAPELRDICMRLGGSLKDTPVTFLLGVKNDKYEAQGVRLASAGKTFKGSPPPSSAYGYGAPGAVFGGCGKGAYGGKFASGGKGAQPTRSVQRHFAPVTNAFQAPKAFMPKGGKCGRKSFSGAAAYLGQLCHGAFKSFSAKSGWGFLNSSSFSEDVFVSFATAPELRDLFGENPSNLEGYPVAFLLAESQKNPGTFEARNVTPAGHKGGKGGKGGAARSAGNYYTQSQPQHRQYTQSQPQRRQHSDVGLPCDGWFKSFSAKDGYGFLQCAEIEGDVFVSFKTAPECRTLLEQVGDLKGQGATFVAHESLSNPGQYEGRDVALSDFAGNGEGGAGAYMSAGHGKTRPTVPVVASPCGKGGKKS